MGQGLSAGLMKRRPSVEVAAEGSNRLEVSGSLTFPTARRAAEAGLRRINNGAGTDGLVIDCSGVTESDSAGLAVLIEWFASASQRGRAVQFQNVPPGIRAAAQISGVAAILGIPE